LSCNRAEQNRKWKLETDLSALLVDTYLQWRRGFSSRGGVQQSLTALTPVDSRLYAQADLGSCCFVGQREELAIPCPHVCFAILSRESRSRDRKHKALRRTCPNRSLYSASCFSRACVESSNATTDVARYCKHFTMVSLLGLPTELLHEVFNKLEQKKSQKVSLCEPPLSHTRHPYTLQ
jgi:hypothetical protein